MRAPSIEPPVPKQTAAGVVDSCTKHWLSPRNTILYVHVIYDVRNAMTTEIDQVTLLV